MSRTAWIVTLLALAIAVFAIRLSGPADLEGYAQARNIGYLFDLTERGHWLAQRDIEGRILSKPPLHTWTMAPFAMAFGVTRTALVLPSFLAIVALTLLVFEIGRRQFGLAAGGFAGFAVILAPMLSKHVGLVRSDALFTLWITAGAWCAYLARTRSTGWTGFWLFAALSTLTKGPLGLLISASGLLAGFFERPSPVGSKKSHLPGIALFVLLCFGWLAAALWLHGRELFDKLFLDELFGQATGARKDSFPGANLPEPALNLLSRFAPFSLLACYAVWRIFRHRADDAATRYFERFLVWWIIPGLVLLSLAAHHRADLVLPLWPPLALLAGRVSATLAQRAGSRKASSVTAAIALLLLAFAWKTYHPSSSARAKVIRYSEDIRKAADAFAATGIPLDQVAYLDTPTTFQLYLGTRRIWDNEAGLRQQAATGKPARYIGTESRDLPLEELGASTAREVFRWPPDGKRTSVVRIFEVAW